MGEALGSCSGEGPGLGGAGESLALPVQLTEDSAELPAWEKMLVATPKVVLLSN